MGIPCSQTQNKQVLIPFESIGQNPLEADTLIQGLRNSNRQHQPMGPSLQIINCHQSICPSNIFETEYEKYAYQAYQGTNHLHIRVILSKSKCL